MLKRLARERGFEGRIVVLGEPDIALGDARLEWADGGIVRERRRFESRDRRAPRRKPKPQPDQIGTAMAHDNDLQLPRLEEADPLALGTLDAPVSAKSAADLEQVFDVPVTVSAVLGNARMPVGDLLKLAPGAVLELDRKVGEAIDIFVNNRLVARGEVVLVDERLGVTMTEIIKGDH